MIDVFGWMEIGGIGVEDVSAIPASGVVVETLERVKSWMQT